MFTLQLLIKLWIDISIIIRDLNPRTKNVCFTAQSYYRFLRFSGFLTNLKEIAIVFTRWCFHGREQ